LTGLPSFEDPLDSRRSPKVVPVPTRTPDGMSDRADGAARTL